jgi:hypothetical protein
MIAIPTAALIRIRKGHHLHCGAHAINAENRETPPTSRTPQGSAPATAVPRMDFRSKRIKKYPFIHSQCIPSAPVLSLLSSAGMGPVPAGARFIHSGAVTSLPWTPYPLVAVSGRATSAWALPVTEPGDISCPQGVVVIPHGE